jgi:multiple sugar transport system substrate-binding protein
MPRLAVLALLSLLACGRAERGNVVTISGSAVGKEGELLARQIARFMAANPGVVVRIQQTPDDATQRHQLYVQWLNAHVGTPDVLQLDVVWTAEFAAAGWIAPLDGADTRDFFPSTLEACRWRSRLYALPWFVDAGMLYRRTDLVPRAPQTLAELDADALHRNVPYGIVWQGARYEGLVTVYAEILGAYGGTILDRDGRVAVSSEAGVRALAFLRDQLQRGIAPREALTWHEEECRFAFQNGKAMFMRNWPYAVASLRDAHIAFAISPMPAMPGGRATATLGGAPLAINAWSAHRQLAQRLIAFLTAPEQMRERFRVAGQYPPRMSLYDDPQLAAARAVVEAATPRPVTPIWAELSDELQVALHRALTGEAEPKAALSDAAARMQRIIDDAALGSQSGGMAAALQK